MDSVSDAICPHCAGRGYTVQTNIIKARQEKIPCDKCKGTGKVIDETLSGVKFYTQVCKVGYWQDYEEGKPVATLHIHLCPVLDEKTRKPAVKPDLFDPKMTIPRVFIEIVNMATKPKYRGQGRMTNLLSRAMGDPKIEWVETNWSDSSIEGRTFLKNKGFIQEGKKLVWRRGNPNAN